MTFADYDWQAPYAACAAKGDVAATRRMEVGFLADARGSAGRTRRDADPGRRDVPQVLLLHAGALDAAVMPRLVQLHRSLGFRFVTLAEADPFYAAATDLARSGPTIPPVRAAAGAVQLNHRENAP